MANFVTIEAEARTRAGKGAARATRRAGKVPAVIYGAHQAPTLIALDPRVVLREVHRSGWRSRLFEVKVNGDAARALIRDVQYHPVTDAPEHVDFQRLAAGETIRVAVAVHFDNEGISPGLKRGGVLNVVRHAVEVYLRPREHPRTVQRRSRRARLQRQRALARPDRHRGRAAGDRRPGFRRRDGGAADQDGRGRRRSGAGRHGSARRGRRRSRQGGRQEGLTGPPPADATCSSGSGSAIRSRAWPGSATISASWQST